MGDRLGIGDFARRTGLSVSAIRFYGDRGLLPPAEVDPTSGYRSYDEAQVADARLVRDLRRLEMGLADVATFLAAPADERTVLLAAHLDGLERRLDDARSVAHAIHARTTRTETQMTAMTLPADDLARALDQVLPAAGTDPERPVLTCVLIEAKDGSLRLVATDSYRLSVRDLAPSAGTDAAFRSLLPAATLRRWRSSITGGDVSVAVIDDHLVVRGDGVDLSAASVPATYPAYEALLDAERDAVQVVVDRGALLDALDAMATGEGSVLLTLRRDSIELVRRDESLSVPASGPTSEAHVALDPTFAADAVRAAVGPEVVLEMCAAIRPVVFRSADDGTYTTMVMPVRLD